ncbi:MAG TPA: hypothetical protein PLG65_05835 [Bacillota bacterium]|nr:hypothetical protein [Bacillota bacterium]
MGIGCGTGAGHGIGIGVGYCAYVGIINPGHGCGTTGVGCAGGHIISGGYEGHGAGVGIGTGIGTGVG